MLGLWRHGSLLGVPLLLHSPRDNACAISTPPGSKCEPSPAQPRLEERAGGGLLRVRCGFRAAASTLAAGPHRHRFGIGRRRSPALPVGNTALHRPLFVGRRTLPVSCPRPGSRAQRSHHVAAYDIGACLLHFDAGASFFLGAAARTARLFSTVGKRIRALESVLGLLAMAHQAISFNGRRNGPRANLSASALIQHCAVHSANTANRPGMAAFPVSQFRKAKLRP